MRARSSQRSLNFTIKRGQFGVSVNWSVKFNLGKEYISKKCPLASIERRTRSRMKVICCWLLLLIVVLGESSSLLESSNDEDFTIERILSSDIEGFSASQEDLEKLRTLLRQTSGSLGSGNDTVIATSQRPCQCTGGVCGCCSKFLYERWNQKICVNVTYDPDEFSFTANILMNDKVFYTRTVSGKWQV